MMNDSVCPVYLGRNRGGIEMWANPLTGKVLPFTVIYQRGRVPLPPPAAPAKSVPVAAVRPESTPLTPLTGPAARARIYLAMSVVFMLLTLVMLATLQIWAGR